MARVRVDPLVATELDEALVLARLAASELDPDHWRRDTLARLRDPSTGGVLVARNAAGKLCGLLTYRIVVGSAPGPSLEIDRLAAFDLLHPRSVAVALIAEAVVSARLQDCASLRLLHPLGAPVDSIALVLASGIGALHSLF